MSIRKTLYSNLRKPQFIGLTSLCVVLIAILIAHKSLFFAAPNDITGNWRYIFYFLILGVSTLLIRYLITPYSTESRRLNLSDILFLAPIYGTLWFLTLEIIFNELFFLIEAKYVFISILLNSLIFIALLLLFNSLRLTSIVGCVFFFIWAIGGYYTQQARGLPVQVHDLMDIPTAMGVAKNYTFEPTVQIITMGILIIIVCAHTFLSGRCVVSERPRQKLVTHISGAALLLIILLVLIRGTAFSNLQVYIDGNRPIVSFQRYGTEIAFIEGVRESQVFPPANYSAESLAEQVGDYSGDIKSTGSPNIIVVMNETFADIDIAGRLGLAEEIMPNYTHLQQNAIKGKVMVSTLGGGTGKSEYEFLTCNSMQFFSGFSSPYVRLGSRLKYSLADVLGAQGYSTIAIHPNSAANYNRAAAYSYMGFDTFYSIESFEGAKTIRGLVSDRSCYKKLYNIVDDTDAPVFAFCVTMQNHSPYDNKDYKSDVSLDGDYPTAEQYLSLIKESDKQLGTLINHFSDCEEDTMIVFFGDHFPALPDEFWKYATGVAKESEDFETQQLYYATPFFIWTNYGLPEQDNVVTSANYLGAFALDKAGVKLSAYMRYVLDMQKTIPGISCFAYYGSDGHFHPYEDANDKIQAALNEYDCIQYNELFDRKHLIPDFFTLK